MKGPQEGNRGVGNSGFDLKFKSSDDAKAIAEKLRNIAGFLASSEVAEALLAEDAVLDGIKVLVSVVLSQRIGRAMEEILGDKNITSDSLTQLVDSDSRVGLLHSFFALVTNYCSHVRSAVSFLKSEGLVEQMKKFWFDPSLRLFYPFSLSSLHNLSTDKEKLNVLLEQYPTILSDSIEAIKNVSDQPEYTLPLVTFLANATTSREARKLLLKSSENWLWEDIFKFLDSTYPTELRQVVSRIVKHMSADVVSHSYLLEEHVNILPVILLPLAGNEVYTEEEYSQMPVELQYLDATKTRDDDVEVRKNLLIALLQLLRLKPCRVKIRDLDAYYILRELHKFETQEDMLDLVEQIVDLLIRKEEEIGEKGDFVDFQVPELEQWLSGEWTYPPEAENA